MKATSLKIKNIGLIADQTVEFNKPLILLYGEIRQGKSTYLNCVRWVCGGAFPSDIIRHGEKEASIELGFDGGCIRREFYVSKKTKETCAREVIFVRNGKPVSNPVSEIKRFLNPFLLDQNHLAGMGEAERKKFFTELFAVDTTELDTEAFNLEREARDLRATIRGYGEIDLTPAEAVDVVPLKSQLAEIREKHSAEVSKVREANSAAVKRNSDRERGAEKLKEIAKTVKEIEEAIKALEVKLKESTSQRTIIESWFETNPKLTELSDPGAPDTTDLETKIQNAAAANVRAEQYAKNKKREDERLADVAKLDAKEKRQKEIKAEKVKKLASLTAESGITGLKFEEDGSFSYQETTAGMLSTSQIMRLSSELSALYPEGFGLELLDRGESLGRSIFEFVERAKADDLTILATIVGEAPAKVPGDIGVFVVENGKATVKA